MPHDPQPLVSVIVPAFNAEATLAETLASVAAQTWRNLEIVVVDDGSTDRTREIASRFAAADPRARVVSIPNSGVAVARNTGAAATSGPFLAPIDADDLWHPRYLETLVGLMLAAPEPPAFAYAPCRLIDPASKVLGSSLNAGAAGQVAYRTLFANLVGNGSGMVIARDAFDAAGGYDPRLHAAGVQGCEDYLLQMMLAARGPACAADGFLVGYRKRAGAMSADARRMTASRKMARRLHAQACPQLVPPSWLRRWIRAPELLADAKIAWGDGQIGRALWTLGCALLTDPVGMTTVLRSRVQVWLRDLDRRPRGPRVDFLAADPLEGNPGQPGDRPRQGPLGRLHLRRLERVAVLDRQGARPPTRASRRTSAA